MNKTITRMMNQRLVFTRISSTYNSSSQAWIHQVVRNKSNKSAKHQPHHLADILQKVQSGVLKVEEAEQLIRTSSASLASSLTYDEPIARSKIPGIQEAPSLDSFGNFANLDLLRATRTGFPEAIYGSGKTPMQIANILERMAKHVNDTNIGTQDEDDVLSSQAILATRVDRELFEQVASYSFSEGEIYYHEMARIISMRASSITDNMVQQRTDKSSQMKTVVVACAGTTDLPVAEEAAVTLSETGVKVERVYDCGVAGLHRILNALPTLRSSDVGAVIVCAGMDGALPSVVGGLVSVPVIACPTSIGYGASFHGVSALLTMLNSCAPGVGVVNVDNGFGAAALAYKCIQ